MWGVATSAYQIEGAATDDGRATSVWDAFSQLPGKIADGSNGDVTCDHYRHWPSDLDLIAELGVGAYRLSVSWPRVLPDGSGKPNQAGLDFYRRLLDGLSERDISATVTVFHWDLPQRLQDVGGWRNRDTAKHLADYAGLLAEELGDRVSAWCTVNEPFEHCLLGHLTGHHAPGLTLPLEETFEVAHHLLLAHGLATQALRAASDAPVMLVNSYAPSRPASHSEADAFAAGLYDQLQNHLFTDPVLLGHYPADLQPLVERVVDDGDLDAISTPIDALGVNYYSINAARAIDGPVPLDVIAPEGFPTTAFGWAVAPEGLTETLTTLRDRYGDRLPPIYVTENGCAYDDVLTPDGHCEDPDRIRFLQGHIDAVRAALEAGVDVRGYYIWSLLDNWEWAEGFTKRFGLVHVDYATQRRTPKSSFAWLRDVIARM